MPSDDSWLVAGIPGILASPGVWPDPRGAEDGVQSTSPCC
jgi:hypothetical protein